MQFQLHLTNRLIRAVAGLHCGGHMWVRVKPACQLVRRRQLRPLVCSTQALQLVLSVSF